MTKETCRCECGYRCGGPGKCELPPFDCVSTDDGKHFVRDCDHKWNGPYREVDQGCYSVLCSICGMSALGHDCMVGP